MVEACLCNFCNNSKIHSQSKLTMTCSVRKGYSFGTIKNVLDFKGGQSEVLEKEVIEHMR